MAWIVNSERMLTYDEALNNAKIIYVAIKKAYPSMTHNTICGFLGNLWKESHVNPHQTELSNTWGYGLTQWTIFGVPNGGIQKLKERMEYFGISGDATDGDIQVKVIIEELRQQGPQWYDARGYTLNEFKKTDSIEYAVNAFCWCYERPNEEYADIEQRIEYAKKFAKDIDGSEPPETKNNQLAVLPPHGNVVLTQGEGSDISHSGTLAMDFAYSGLVQVPYYAPFDCVVMGVDRNEACIVWQSEKEVRCADGTDSYVTFNCLHDDFHMTINVGDKKKKGEVIGRTGNSGNSFGDHLHIECSKSKFTHIWEGGGLPRPSHMYDVFSVCDNVTKEKINLTLGSNVPVFNWKCILDWVDGEGGTTPPKPPIKENDDWFWDYGLMGLLKLF